MTTTSERLLPKQLIVVAHTPSSNTLRLITELIKKCQRFITEQQLENVQIRRLEALKAEPDDILNAEAVLLFTPENLGYMSGGMKDFFDRCYYPVLEEKQGMPVAAIIRAGHDGTGTQRGLETITTGLKWRWVQPPLICHGDWQEDFIDQSVELASGMLYALSEGII